MGASKKIDITTANEEMSNIFTCRRKSDAVRFVGKDRRQKREDFNKAWWLKVITLTE